MWKIRKTRPESVPDASSGILVEYPKILDVLDFVRKKYPLEVQSWAEAWVDDLARYLPALKIIHFFLPRTGSNFLAANFHAQDWCFCFSERIDLGLIKPGAGTIGTEGGLSYEKFAKAKAFMWKRPLHDLSWLPPASVTGADDFLAFDEMPFSEKVSHNMLGSMTMHDIKFAIFSYRHPWSTFQSLKRLQQVHGSLRPSEAKMMNSIPETYCQMLNIMNFFDKQGRAGPMFFHEILIDPKQRAKAMNEFFSQIKIVRDHPKSDGALQWMTPEYQDITEWVKNHKFSEDLEGWGYFNPRRKISVVDEMKVVANRKIDFLSEIESRLRSTNQGKTTRIFEAFVNFYKNFERQSNIFIDSGEKHET